MKTNKISALILSIFCLVSCAKKDKIRHALESLSERQNDDAYVIFKAIKTNKYIQFSVRDNQVIIFNFPIYTVSKSPSTGIVKTYKVATIPKSFNGKVVRHLTEEEEKKLKELLKEWNMVYKENIEVGKTIDDGAVTCYFKTLEGDFDISAAEHSKFIKDYFEKVFEIKNYQLKIREN